MSNDFSCAGSKRRWNEFEDIRRDQYQRRRLHVDKPFAVEDDNNECFGQRSISPIYESQNNHELDGAVWPWQVFNENDVEMGDIEHEKIDENKEICYGMICNAKATFRDGFWLSDSGFAMLFDPAHYEDSLSIQLSFGTYVLKNNSVSSNVAILDQNMSSILENLSTIGKIRCTAFVDRSGEFAKIRGDCTNKHYIISLFLILYSKKSLLEAVGKLLSKARIYLQHPISIDCGIEYENPHYYETNTDHIITLEKSTTPFDAIHIPSTTIQKFPPPQTMVEEVLQTIERKNFLKKTRPDPRVVTELLPHQLEALNFILQRESGLTDEDLSLWKAQTQVTRPCYQHCIIGSRTDFHPGDSRGGLLADEMGLGKTLSMISAIVTTLDVSRLTHSTRDERADSLLQSQATLVLAPSAVLLDGWATEIERHVQVGTLRVLKYHGPKREADIYKLLDYDIVLTTVPTLSADFAKKCSSLRLIHWYRLIVDEAHFVRNPATKQFKAVSSLSTDRRWLLSGTPVQNSLDDLAALVKLLRIPEFEKKAIFQKFIVSPLRTRFPNSTNNLRLLLNSICLRRLSKILEIPDVTYRIQSLDLSEKERSIYEKILENSSKDIEQAISTKTSVAAYSIILKAILRTRMLCNEGTHQRVSSASRLGTPWKEKEEILVIMQEGDEELSLAQVNSGDASEGSTFSSSSIAQSTDFLSPTSTLVRVGYSTKLYALMKNLKEDQSKGKSIVFSCWKTTLDLVESLLQSSGIQYQRIDGNFSSSERSKIILKFDTDPLIRVILMTTGTGAVGLNLTVANQVHILEPQWNPSIESQAIGRVLRLTQKQPVTVTRYITNNTIEQAIQERQSKKLALAELTLTENLGSEAQMQQRLQNLKSLLY